MNEDLRLGSTEAAVRSCVNMLAALTSQREEHLAYWLDLYYQVRRAYEIETGGVPDPQLIRKEDLRPLLQDAVRDAMRGVAKQEAGKRMEKKQEAAPEIKRRATPYKRQVADRLAEARKNGATIAAIAKASGGAVTEGQILSILEGQMLATEVYQTLDTALAAIGA